METEKKIKVVVTSEEEKEKAIEKIKILFKNDTASIDSIDVVIDEELCNSLVEKDLQKDMMEIIPSRNESGMEDITGWVKETERKAIKERKENNKWAMRHYKHK